MDVGARIIELIIHAKLYKRKLSIRYIFIPSQTHAICLFKLKMCIFIYFSIFSLFKYGGMLWLSSWTVTWDSHECRETFLVFPPPPGGIFALLINLNSSQKWRKYYERKESRIIPNSKGWYCLPLKHWGLGNCPCCLPPSLSTPLFTYNMQTK